MNNILKASEDKYCKCKLCICVTVRDEDMEEFGYWESCTTCGKRLEDGFHGYSEDDDFDDDYDDE